MQHRTGITHKRGTSIKTNVKQSIRVTQLQYALFIIRGNEEEGEGSNKKKIKKNGHNVYTRTPTPHDYADSIRSPSL